MSIKSYYQELKSAYNIPWARRGHLLDREISRCPYCASRRIKKRGHRLTKHEKVQLYQCKACGSARTLSPTGSMN